MKLTIQTIKSIASASIPNSSAVKVECDMNEGQMFDALLQFLEHVTEATWAEWERAIDKDSCDMVPCRHEFYQGICIHCELTASIYRQNKFNTGAPLSN